MKMHTLSLAAVPVALLLAGCAPAATPEPTFTSAPPPVPLPTTTPEPTPTPEPTATPTPALAPDSKQIAACQPDPTLSGESPYPAPTGPYQVGVTAFQLVDDTRPEPFTTDATDYRVVTIFVWYPAEVAGDAEPCSYTSTFDLENSDFDGLVALYAGDVDSTYRRLSAWTLVAYPDATAASDQPRYPVVIYSNILAGLPISQSSQFQELASQGYIAIDVLHTYGYPVDCCFKVNGVTINLGSHERLAGNDILFVLDQLAELDANQPANALPGRSGSHSCLCHAGEVRPMQRHKARPIISPSKALPMTATAIWCCGLNDAPQHHALCLAPLTGCGPLKS